MPIDHFKCSSKCVIKWANLTAVLKSVFFSNLIFIPVPPSPCQYVDGYIWDTSYWPWLLSISWIRRTAILYLSWAFRWHAICNSDIPRADRLIMLIISRMTSAALSTTTQGKHCCDVTWASWCQNPQAFQKLYDFLSEWPGFHCRKHQSSASPTSMSMMTSSYGNIFRVTGHLCGEFTGHRWIPLTKATDVEIWCFLWSVPEQTIAQTILLRMCGPLLDVYIYYCLHRNGNVVVLTEFASLGAMNNTWWRH